MVQESFERPQSKLSDRKPDEVLGKRRHEMRRLRTFVRLDGISPLSTDKLRKTQHHTGRRQFTSRWWQIVPGAAQGSTRRLIRGVIVSLGRGRSTLLGALRMPAVAGKLHGPARVVAVVAAILFAFIHQATAGGMRALLLLLFSHRSPLSGRRGPAGSRSGPS
jgi:hypothetical protein